MADRYEYQHLDVASGDFERVLSDLGAQGWRVIQIGSPRDVLISSGSAFGTVSVQREMHVVFLERVVPADAPASTARMSIEEQSFLYLAGYDVPPPPASAYRERGAGVPPETLVEPMITAEQRERISEIERASGADREALERAYLRDLLGRG